MYVVQSVFSFSLLIGSWRCYNLIKKQINKINDQNSFFFHPSFQTAYRWTYGAQNCSHNWTLLEIYCECTQIRWTPLRVFFYFFLVIGFVVVFVFGLDGCCSRTGDDKETMRWSSISLFCFLFTLQSERTL